MYAWWNNKNLTIFKFATRAYDDRKIIATHM